MPRGHRQLIDNGHYHLIARGNNRLFIFPMRQAFLKFKELILTSKGKYPWKLSHYCIMSNHIHLLGQIERGKDMPKLMQFLLFEYSRWYRSQFEYVGHLWQGRYKSPIIQKESYFLECGRYIERNPLRAGIVKSAEDYEWSSYRHYAFGVEDSLVDGDLYYSELGANPEDRQREYREFVKLDGPYDKLVDTTLLKTFF